MISKQNLNVLIIKYDMDKIHFNCSGKIKDKISTPVSLSTDQGK